MYRQAGEARLKKRSYKNEGGGWIRRLLRRIAIPRQWLIAYFILIVIPAAVILYGYYERSATILKNEVMRTMQLTLEQAGSNLSYRLEHIEEISDAAFMNNKLHQYLSVSDTDSLIDTQLEVVKDLRNLVESVQSNSDVFRVRLFVDKSKLYAGEKVNFFSLESLMDKPWYNDIIAANGSIVWSGIYEQTFLEAGNVDVLSSARMLRDPDHYDRISGVMMIDVKEKMVSDLLSKLEFSSGTQVYLVDSAGTIIDHTDRARIGTQIDSEIRDRLNASRDSDGHAFRLHKNSDEVMFTTVSPTNWKLVAQSNGGQLSPQAVKLTQRSSLTSLLEYFALFTLLPFVLLAIIVRGMNQRVRKVITVIRREGTDSLEELAVVSNSDFLVLERSVDHLILRVRTLVEEKYLAEIHEREAQLQALQAQINPHFLYNTLDMINWIAIGKGATDISQMIDSLAKYFRLSLNKGKSIVSVEDEVRLAEVYLNIQQSRFPNTFDVQFEVDPQIASCQIPKLILQPIVENALLHGIRKMKHKRGLISIIVKEESGDLIITISDNGIGMDEERSQQLLRAAPLPEEKMDGIGSSYGLFNVNERIKLYAGDHYGLSITSELGAGTTVTIRLRAELPQE
ncbi:sensor histidine kinase [Paenibacillus lupini]|uniref:cache domain-containing sensor histidine kinase n=1 Tax=Paenibacillus lupini TaxID=1450204 RepID=UPI0014230796|nr:sensor histidine kinase [Paenibacillus lupini]NIK24039.1 two-component system sensor histidine kinase YesM [Paenibacillus lupini]